MIRGLIGIVLTLLILVMSLLFMARCAATVVCAPEPEPVSIHAVMAGPPVADAQATYKRFRRMQEERRKQKDKRRPAPTYDGTGRPQFILE